MNNLLKAILFFCVLAFPAVAQEVSQAEKPDSVCFRYSFLKGDSLLYLVTASDSIDLMDQPRLVKKRTETVLLICDSVNANGHYFLSQSLIGFTARESANDTVAMMRFESPWVNRRVWFEIDSVGRRYSWGVDDDKREAITPGGAFQQNLIFPIYASCKSINESWVIRTADDLPENGVPAPARDQTTMLRALEPLDTLGEHVNRFQIALTGQGTYVAGPQGRKIRTTSVLTTYGLMSISTEKHVPIHFFTTSETKLKIENQRGQSTQGKQFNQTNYTLIRYKSKAPQKIPLKTKLF